MAIFKERSVMDGMHTLYHSVLQYKLYLRILEEGKQKARDLNVKRKIGVPK
jgi:hypothetical protein